MASTTNAAVIFCILVFLQVLCAVSGRPTEEKIFQVRQDVPATMTVNGFQQGEGGGGPAACDGQYHSDDDVVLSLSSEWYAGGVRCGRPIRIAIADSSNRQVIGMVVDECAGCDNEVGASSAIWKAFNLDPSLGEVDIKWSDLNGDA